MERLWTGNFLKTTFASLLLFTSFYFLIPTLPLFVTGLGGSESQVGLVIGIFTLSAVVIRPIVGGLLDRFGRRVFVLAGLIVFALTMYLYHFVAAIGVLIALRIFHGISWATSTTSLGTAITDIIPPRRRGEGMGWYGLAMTVGMALGPMIGLSIVKNSSFDTLFTLAMVLGLGAFVLGLLTKSPFEKQGAGGKMAFFEKSVVPMMVLTFFLTITYGGITSFLPLFSASLHVDSGTFFLVYAIVLTLTRPVAGRLSDRYGEVMVLVPGLVLMVLALLVLSLATGLGGVIATAILYGVGFGAVQPLLQVLTIRLAPPQKKGVANASFFTAFDLGIGLGTVILGYVSQALGFRVLFGVCTASAVIGLFITLALAKRLNAKPAVSQS